MSESDEKPTFEKALAELDQIVRDLEDGQVSLEDSIARYEHGVGLLKHCYGTLQKAERRIVELTGQDADGNPTTRPFEHSAAMNDSQPASS